MARSITFRAGSGPAVRASGGRRPARAGPDESPPYPESDKTARVESVVYDVVQILGSLLVLAAFLLTLSGRCRQDAWAALSLNLAGSGVLAVIAVVGREWGFLLLEVVWAAATATTLARRVAGPDR